jgi:predicted ATPase
VRLKTLQVEKFKGLNDFCIDFNDGITVLIGENGTGKTTILETVYRMLNYEVINIKDKMISELHNNMKQDPFLVQDSEFKGCKIELDLDKEKGWIVEGYIKEDGRIYDNAMILELKRNINNGVSMNGNWSLLNHIASRTIVGQQRKDIPHVVYMPTEINFKKYKVDSVKRQDRVAGFGIILNSETVSTELKDFLVYQHYRDLEDKESGKKGDRIKKYKDLYNSFFEDKEFIGIKDLEPLFKIKSTGETHSVDELSSGEKQIFFRAGSILEYNLENSIILIDEPEISMHPEWQQKILDFYRKVAGKNQLIIATHSPHIVSSCRKEEVRVLVRENDKVQIKEYIEGTYGRTIEQLLFSVFDLKSVRDANVQEKIDRFKALYINKENLNDDKKSEMNKLKIELTSFLDPDDPELSLIDIEENTNKLKTLLNDLKGK